MSFRTIIFEVTEGVATIELNRPPGNAIDLAMAHDLMRAAIECGERADVRAVIVTGAGNMFCAGGDLKSFAELGEALPVALKELTTYLHAAVSRLSRMAAPVIAAVNGTAAGAGMSLACACDFVLAAESAKFAMAYTRAGLVPDGSSTWYLPRLVGHRRALELMIENRVLSADEAVAWGIANRAVPDSVVLAEARELAASLASGPTRSFGAVKKLLALSATESLETQLEHETEAIAAAAHTHDGREGIAAFVHKRKPAFTGR